MLRLHCPYCGLRDEKEFSYHGQANLQRPSAGASEQDFFQAVYLRDNPCGDHEELWQHSGGCRAFLKVLRNTQTHEVLATAWPYDDIGEVRK